MAAVVAALAVRAVYAWQLADAPVYLAPVLDGAAHVEWARGMADGSWPGPQAFFRAPGYPVALALLLSIFGDDPGRVAIAQLLGGAIVPGLMALLAGRLFGRGMAWLAGLGGAVYPTLPFFDAQLLAVTLAVPLTAGAVIASARTIRTGRRRDTLMVRREWDASLILAGVLWSLAAIVRPPLLLPGLLLPFFVGGRGWRRRAIVFVLVLSAPFVVTVRNAAVGDPAFIASGGGLNFHLGNGAAADGHSATFAEAPGAVGYRMVSAARQLAERDEGRVLGSAEVSRYWTRRALAEISADPSRWIRLMTKKCVLFAGAREIPNNHDLALFAERFGFLRWPAWGLWFPLALVGAAHACRWAEGRYVVLAATLIAAGSILFFVNARFRLPVVPIVVVLGAGGVAALVEAVRSAAWRRLGAGLAAVAVGGALAHANPYRIPAEPWVGSYVLMAEAERHRGEPVRSLRWIERALEHEPGLYIARLAQVQLLRDAGQRAEALRLVERVLTVQPDDPEMLRQSAVLLDLTSRPSSALPRIEHALRVAPDLPGARADRAVILARLDRAPEAIAVLRELVTAADGSEAARARELLRRIEGGEIPPAPDADGPLGD